MLSLSKIFFSSGIFDICVDFVLIYFSCAKARPLECIPLTISYHLYFLRISKVWKMLHHGSVGRVCHQKIVFLSVSIFLFFDEVSNICNRILSSQKP